MTRLYEPLRDRESFPQPPMYEGVYISVCCFAFIISSLLLTLLAPLVWPQMPPGKAEEQAPVADAVYSKTKLQKKNHHTTVTLCFTKSS